MKSDAQRPEIIDYGRNASSSFASSVQLSARRTTVACSVEFTAENGLNVYQCILINRRIWW